jgi:capsule polysaccharide export protein KpsE/RkpR
VGTLALTRPGRRRAIIAVLVLICVLLALFPQRYRSAVTLAPSDPSALGLSGTLSQLGAASSVFGNQAAVEITVRVAKSVFVRDQVIDKLGLVKNHRFANKLEAERFLDREVEVRSLRGGLVQIETKQRDPAFAESLMRTVSDATRQRLAVINRQQTGYKRHVLEQLVAEAGERRDRAQSAYDTFRLQTRYSDPRAAIDAIGDRIPALQSAIKAKEVQLNAARQFATDDNMSVKQIAAEIDALRRQLTQQQALDPDKENSVGRVVEQSTISKKLERELLISQSLYESYTKYLQGTAVEDLTSNANLRLIEPAFIDTSRQINLPFALAAIIIILLGGAIEIYGFRPPLEARAV